MRTLFIVGGIAIAASVIFASIPTNQLINREPIVFEQKYTAPGCLEVERTYMGHPIVAFPPDVDNPEVRTMAIGHILLYTCPNEDTLYVADLRED